MKELITRDDVELILRSIDGESIPIVFIDHITIYYMDGTVKSIEGSKVRQLFPKVKQTTMGILKNNKDIAEISVKVDVDRIYDYLNDFAGLAMERIQEAAQRAIDKRSKK